jgi:hypothetical protein
MRKRRGQLEYWPNGHVFIRGPQSLAQYLVRIREDERSGNHHLVGVDKLDLNLFRKKTLVNNLLRLYF